MRKVIGIKALSVYLDTINYPMSEEEINNLISSKSIPHHKPIGGLIVFNLDYIDEWVNEQEIKT